MVASSIIHIHICFFFEVGGIEFGPHETERVPLLSQESLFDSIDASWFSSLLLRPKIMTLVLDKLTSRLEEVQNSYSLIYKFL